MRAQRVTRKFPTAERPERAARRPKLGDNRLPALAVRINAAHGAIKRQIKATITGMMAAGDDLIEAKRLVGHGHWLAWLRSNCPDISERTASLYMRFAKWRAVIALAMAKSATVADLELDQLKIPMGLAVGPFGVVDAIAAIQEAEHHETRVMENRWLLAAELACRGPYAQQPEPKLDSRFSGPSSYPRNSGVAFDPASVMESFTNAIKWALARIGTDPAERAAFFKRARSILSSLEAEAPPPPTTPSPAEIAGGPLLGIGSGPTVELATETMAHQHAIRERLAAANPAPAIVAEIRTAIVKEIDRATAKRIIEQYEYLGTMPAVSRLHFGIFFDGHLGGVAVYGDEAGENLGVWDRYGYSGMILALQRGACLHWTPPHTASKLIRGSMRMLPERFRIVTATVDPTAGEVGIIYQAAGFFFVGVMSDGGRAIVRVNGKTVSERQVGRLYGTQGVRALAELGLDASAVQRKGRYFAFRGSRAEQHRLRAAIAHLVKPFPKRPQPPPP